MKLASSWCFHLLTYDARNHETEKNGNYGQKDIYAPEYSRTNYTDFHKTHVCLTTFCKKMSLPNLMKT